MVQLTGCHCYGKQYTTVQLSETYKCIYNRGSTTPPPGQPRQVGEGEAHIRERRDPKEGLQLGMPPRPEGSCWAHVYWCIDIITFNLALGKILLGRWTADIYLEDCLKIRTTGVDNEDCA